MLSNRSRLTDLLDPRNGNARRHNFLDVLTIALTESICGAESCVDCADFASARSVLSQLR
jgi:hypothetical protein